MARKVSIEKKLEKHIAEIEAQIEKLQQDLALAKANYENYVTHKDVIESILSLREGEAVVKPKRKYTRRKKAENQE
ncbi:MAG: hypothetical protein WCY86_07325 [Spirosomataceae bacterium]|jgi:hypothetical protein